LGGVLVVAALTIGATLGLAPVTAGDGAVVVAVAVTVVVAGTVDVAVLLAPLVATALSCGSATAVTVASVATRAGTGSANCAALAAETAMNNIFDCLYFTVRATCNYAFYKQFSSTSSST
jgi:hypothetical protein